MGLVVVKIGWGVGRGVEVAAKCRVRGRGCG